ncbi:hypothetical protein EDB87DRAFT_1586171 [Lactarius vividus]|nr:hypothetical protein EDB87DRAFT_1586171 [Lactarius vividus]
MDLPPGTHLYRSRNVLYRGGSVSASDPFGIHAEQNLADERALMSRLTIVRVASDDHDSTPASPDSRRPSWSPTPSSLHLRPGQAAQARRLSFASSSFAQESFSPTVPNSPPSYANRKRRPSTSLYAQRSSLTPEQLCDLAQSSLQPRPLVKTDAVESHSAQHSPIHSPAHSSATSLSNVPFLPLPDGQFLPFLDRPNEVLEFISTSPTNRLMALLEQAFPAHLRRRRPRPEEAQPSSPPGQTGAPRPPEKLSYRDTPPQAWSYEALLEWMSTVSRSEAEDAVWVHSIRACVMARSEQICVTLLAALGVPMEGGADLDVVSLPIGLPDADLALPELSTGFADGFLSQLPTVPEAPTNEDEDAFQLEILPITFESTDAAIKSDAQRRSRSGSTSSWSSSSRSSSRLSTTMESIGESDSERDVVTGTDSVPVESEFQVSDEHLPGEVTARAGSPVGMNATKTPELIPDHDPLSAVTEQWENDQFSDGDRGRMTWDQVENCYGLSISTCARLAADPSLPSTVPHSAMPHAVASSVRPKQRRNTVQVSHVLSGAPGYEGFTWRPGGPLFPMSFTGSTGGSEGSGTGLGIGGNSDSVITSNPVLKPRSRSRTKRSASTGSRAKTNMKSPLAPPNSPVMFLV